MERQPASDMAAFVEVGPKQISVALSEGPNSPRPRDAG